MVSESLVKILFKWAYENKANFGKSGTKVKHGLLIKSLKET